jgi:hypothetical protein
MPLQIRRGSSVQRLAITPLDGELIWDQTEKRLYVGDGVEAGGTIATGYNNTDAVLAIGSALDNGTHDGIIFTYDDTSISTVLSGTANISIVSDDGSTLIVDSANSILNGNVIGDVQGSVIAFDDTTLIDFNSKTAEFNELNIAGELFTFNQDTVNIQDPIDRNARTVRFLKFSPDGRFTECIVANTKGSLSSGRLVLTYGGTPVSPDLLSLGDAIATDIAGGYIGEGDISDNNNYVPATIIRSKIDPHGDLPNSTNSPGRLDLYTVKDGNLLNAKGLSIDSRGYVSILKGENQSEATLDINGFMKLSVLESEPDTLSDGMIAIADGTNWNPLGVLGKKQFVIYLSSQWRSIFVEP